MEYEYDMNADCAYILINKLPYAYSKEIDETRFVDYAQDGTVIGIELLYVSGGVDTIDLPYESEIGQFLKKHNVKVLAGVISGNNFAVGYRCCSRANTAKGCRNSEDKPSQQATK